MVDFGTDIESSWTSNPQGDFKIISGVDNAGQAIRNRLLTKYDELLSLGYIGYGNKSHEVPGMTDIENAKEYIRFYTIETLSKEPRVKEIINITTSFSNKVMTVDISLKMIDSDVPENMIITINMEV